MAASDKIKYKHYHTNVVLTKSGTTDLKAVIKSGAAVSIVNYNTFHQMRSDGNLSFLSRMSLNCPVNMFANNQFTVTYTSPVFNQSEIQTNLTVENLNAYYYKQDVENFHIGSLFAQTRLWCCYILGISGGLKKDSSTTCHFEHTVHFIISFTSAVTTSTNIQFWTSIFAYFVLPR